MQAPIIRPARVSDAETLTALALRSKQHWGYSQAFMDKCRSELTVEPQRILSERFDMVVASINSSIVGYYSLEHLAGGNFELDALFVDPPHIGKGIGKRLIDHAMQRISQLGGTSFVVQGDPNAENFYVAAGGRKVATRESGSIPGRFLPVFEISVSGKNA